MCRSRQVRHRDPHRRLSIAFAFAHRHGRHCSTTIATIRPVGYNRLASQPSQILFRKLLGKRTTAEARGAAMLTKILVVYSAVVTTLLAAFTLAGAAAAKVQRVDEIDVHR